jgi:hypothetical protein
VTGVEIAVGYLFAWAVGNGRRAPGRAGTEADPALHAGMERLHDAVGRALGEEAALRRLAEEAESGRTEPTYRTRQSLQLALEDAAERDQDFAGALREALADLRAARGADGDTTGNIFLGPVATRTADGAGRAGTPGA